eukprot:symbB.v1.2.035123.t1/scaffold4665.1/size36745/1
METHGVLGPPREFSHIYSYQTADSYCVAIQLRPPYEGGGGTRQIHKITSEWDSRKGVEDLTPNDLMIKFTERSIEVCKRGGSSAWHMIRGLHGPTLQQLNKEKCYWTMTKPLGGQRVLNSFCCNNQILNAPLKGEDASGFTIHHSQSWMSSKKPRHGGRYWLISLELVKKTPGKLWNRLMRDEREANRPSMKWDKDMQKTPMIMDKSGKFTPSTYCDPQNKPKYEQEE